MEEACPGERRDMSETAVLHNNPSCVCTKMSHLTSFRGNIECETNKKYFDTICGPLKDKMTAVKVFIDDVRVMV